MKSPELKISEHDLKILQDILKNYPNKFYAYGSRARGTNSKFSDLDLLVMDNIPLTNLLAQFEESNLSIKIDIKTKDSIDQSFYDLIKDDLVELPRS